MMSAPAADCNGTEHVAVDFLRTLFGQVPPGRHILVWTAPDKVSRWLPTGQLDGVEGTLRPLCSPDRNVYVGVAVSPQDFGPRKRCEAASAAGIVGLWADIDITGPNHKATNLPGTVGEAVELANCLGVPPTVIVHTGGGIQPWWLFNEPWLFSGDDVRQQAADLAERWQAALRRRAAARGWRLDSTQDLARILRLPGTWNVKGEQPVAVRVLRDGGERYDPAELAILLEAEEADEEPTPPHPDPAPSRNGNGFTAHAKGEREVLVKRCRAYIAKKPPSISGKRGHDACWAAALIIFRGFGLTAEEGRPLMEEFNARCEPNWSPKELDHKIRQAIEKGKLPMRCIVDRLDREDAARRNGSKGAAKAEQQSPPPRFHFVGLRTFLAGDYRQEYFVPRVLARCQPGVIGGPSKTLKTSIALDLAVSVATATPFLGTFPVPTRSRVAVVSGESGRFAIWNTIRRILAARGIDPADTDDEWLHLEFTLPTFTDAVTMGAFADTLAGLAAEAVIIDPVYLALGEADARSIFEMGRALRPVAENLLKRGTTPILCHHANRVLQLGEVMGLQHLSYAGLAEFSRQWLLLNRRTEWQGDGVSDLWLSVGGSAGHGGLWSMRVEEGVADEQGNGRRWDVRVTAAAEARRADGDQKEQARRRQTTEKDRADDDAVMAALDRLDPGKQGATFERVRTEARLPRERMERSVSRLRGDGLLEEINVLASIGSGAKRSARGLRRPLGQEV